MLGRRAGVPSLGAAIIALVLLAVVLAAAAWLAIRRDDRPSLLALVVGAVALVAATITLSILPVAVPSASLPISSGGCGRSPPSWWQRRHWRWSANDGRRSWSQR